MEFKRKFGKQKRTKPQKGLFFILLLAIVLYLWFNVDGLIKALF